MGVYNVRIKEYLHSTKITKYSNPIFYDKKKSSIEDAALLDDDMEEDIPEQEEKITSEQTSEQAAHSLQVSLNRTKNVIYDLAKSNDWEWFITFTFDPNRYDSTDYDVVVKMLKRFIDNMRKNYAPNMVYLIVPELHADGRKFHFHGLLTNVQWMEFEPSGIRDNDGEMIYNVLRWKYGFSTASKIKNTVRASAYITKYITKDCVQHTKNKRRYFASRNIKRPVEQKLNIDLGLLDIIQTYKPDFMKSTVVPAAHQRVTYLEIDD